MSSGSAGSFGGLCLDKQHGSPLESAPSELQNWTSTDEHLVTMNGRSLDVSEGGAELGTGRCIGLQLVLQSVLRGCSDASHGLG